MEKSRDGTRRNLIDVRTLGERSSVLCQCARTPLRDIRLREANGHDNFLGSDDVTARTFRFASNGHIEELRHLRVSTKDRRDLLNCPKQLIRLILSEVIAKYLCLEVRYLRVRIV